MLHEQDCVLHVDPAEAYRSGYALFTVKRYGEAQERFAAGVRAAQDETLRSRLLLGCAMCQYYLGEFTAMEQTTVEMSALQMAPEVRSRWLMLRGRLLGHRREYEAFDLYSEAEATFRELGIHQDEAWAQLSAARLALVMGLHDKALDAVSRVSFELYLPKARLLESEIRLAMGDLDSACSSVDAIAQGEYGGLDDVDQARLLYVRSAVHFYRGDRIEAGFLLGEARNKALIATQRDYELIDSIERLHAELAAAEGVI